MSSQKKASFQDRWKERLKEESRDAFFGRGDEIALFRDSLTLPAEKRERIIFNVHGLGGVGKTFLLKHFRQIAEEQKVLSGWSNDAQRNVVEVMAQLSEELRTQGVSLKSFEERLRTYRQKRADLEADPEVSASALEFLGRTATKAGLWVGATYLSGGLLMPSFLNADELAAKVGEGVAFIARKLKKDDVQLVRDPIAVLTPLWLSDLHDVCEQRSVVFFLDAFEHCSEYLDEWLRDILRGHYGETSLNLLFAIAGQRELPRDTWRDYESFIARMPLNSFTEEQTRTFLKKRGLSDDKVATELFRKTQGLPVLMALLATQRPGERMTVDPHETAIEHFLKRVEPRHRQVALDAALPRRLNLDIVAELSGAEHAEALFTWLKRMPFVQRHADGWEYHPVVRHLMLAYKHKESPEGWSTLHRRLGDFFERLQKNLGLPEARHIQDAVWREHALTVLYHRVCENPHRSLGLVLNGFLAALKFQRAFAREWAELLKQAEEDAGSQQVLRWGERLVAALKAIEEGRPSEAIGTFTALLARDELEKIQLGVAFNWRGYLYRNNRQYKEALEDLSAAIELNPNDDESLADRARVLFLLQRHDEALEDLGRAVAINPSAPNHLVTRSMLLVSLNRIDDANDDVNRAMRLDPQSHIMLFHQLMVALRQGDSSQLAEAFARFSRQIPEFVETIREAIEDQPLETTLEELSFLPLLTGISADYWQSPLAEHQRALLAELVGGNSAPLVRGTQANAAAVNAYVHQQKGELAEAMTAIDLAIQLDPDDVRYVLLRAELRTQLHRPEEALADLDQAVRLAPQSAEVFSRRGALQHSLGHIVLAIEDFSRAIDLEPSPWRLQMRSFLYRVEGRYPEALTDVESAMKLQPENMLLVFFLLSLHALMSNMEGVVEAYARLAAQAPLFVQQLKGTAGPDPELHPAKIHYWVSSTGMPLAVIPELVDRLTAIVRVDMDAGTRAVRSDAASAKASSYLRKQQFSEALAAVDEALELDPGYAPHWLERAQTYKMMGRMAEALSDVNQARALQLDSARVQLSCADAYLQMNRLEEGLATLDHVLALEPGMTGARAKRSTALLSARRYGEALEEISRALEQDPGVPPLLYIHGILSMVHERYADALEDMEEVAARDSAFIPDWPNLRGELLARLGRHDEALKVYQQVLEKKPETLSAAYNVAVTRAHLEGPATVSEELAEVIRRLESLRATNPAVALVRLGGIEALTGSAERALELLKEALSLDAHLIHWAKGDLAWSSLREDPRFQDLLK